MGDALALNDRQIATVKRTVAADTNDTEFDLFVEVCKRAGLDPFRKQIFPVVYNKDNPKKRRMVIVIGQDGQRVIAARCGNYRPAGEPTEFLIDPDLKSQTNPLGLVYARVRLWQQDKQGQWWPVSGEAYWDEFAPIADEWGEDKQTGQRRPTGRKILDQSGNWAKMPRVMLQKCATMQALRAGWPEHFAGLYDETETDRQRVQELSASEIVHEAEAEERLRKLGGKDALMIQFDPGDALQRVPVGQFADRIMAYLGACDGPAALADFRSRNRESLREFWARSPADGLEIKKAMEAAEARLRAVDFQAAE